VSEGDVKWILIVAASAETVFGLHRQCIACCVVGGGLLFQQNLCVGEKREREKGKERGGERERDRERERERERERKKASDRKVLPKSLNILV
jgi:hypothetical protein